MYIERALEKKFLRMNSFFKAVLVTGARQVGKTTMLRHLSAGTERTYVTMDDYMARELAQNDPALFFQTYRPPLLIDEIQKAPQLFERIKIICDESDETGLFWLTGSQSYAMMRNVRESLAGRVGILELFGLSADEADGVRFTNALDFSLSTLIERQREAKPRDVVAVFDRIWRGGMPQAAGADAEERREYYNSYVNTYLMRDAAEAGGVTDGVRFGRFLAACAALAGETLNFKTLADAADVSQPTAKTWTQVLEGLGVVYLLRPYSGNALKRLVKSPKLYFCDTGLCAHLSMWLTRDTRMNGAASGHYFENHVVTELLKYYSASAEAVNLSYYRDSNAKEIDLIIEADGAAHPFEIKKSASPDRREVKKFDCIDGAGRKRGYGGIVCMCWNVTPIDAQNCFLPCWVI